MADIIEASIAEHAVQLRRTAELGLKLVVPPKDPALKLHDGARLCLKEGTLQKKGTNLLKRLSPRTILLFTDLFLVVKEEKNKYLLRTALFLTTGTTVNNLPASDKKFPFEVRTFICSFSFDIYLIGAR